MPIKLSELMITRLKDCFINSQGDRRLFDLFIPPFGGIRWSVPLEQRFPLLERLPQAIQNPIDRSFLILGDSGLGKTTFSLWLCAYFWDNLAECERLPIYIHLPQIIENGLLPSDILDVFLRNYFTESERIEIKHQPILLILDGYDEISDKRDIYAHNRWYSDRGFDVKVATCCRPEGLGNGEDLKALFEVNGSLEVFYLQDFDDGQIQEYLRQCIDNQSDEFKEQYAGTAWVTDWRHYDDWLTRLPALKALAKTPFLLSLIVQSLPRIVELYADRGVIEQSKLTQTDVFEAFIENWFLYQAIRLEKRGEES